MAYQADIVIAVKGATQLTNLQKQIEATAASVNAVNAKLSSQGIFANNLNNLQKTVSQSTQAMRSAAAGTSAQKQAIDIYVKSLAAAEKAEIQLAAAIKRRQQELGLATKTTTQASGAGLGKRVGGAISGSIIGGAFPLLFGQGAGAATGGAVGGLIGGLAGPGGSFAGSLLGTLLGDIASKGAKVKELAADIGFSAEQTKQLEIAFAQAGREADKFQAAVQNIRGLGLSLDDQSDSIRLVSSLTETYGGQIDKVANAFTSALESGRVSQATLNQLTSQGIPIQDALAKKYNVSRDAILEMAKKGTISVQTLTDTLVTMGNEGELAGKKPKSAFDQFTIALGNTTTAIGILATQLASTLSPVLDAILIKATDVLNSINAALAAGQIGVGQKQNFKRQAEAVVAAQAGPLPGGPFGAGNISVQFGGKRYTGQASDVVSQITNALINEAVRQATPAVTTPKPGTIGGITVRSQAAPSVGTKAKGPKPPENRTADLLDDLKAMELMSITQDGIRDALFESNKQLAIQLEYDQKVYDINRDTSKALRDANYETEKTVIRAQEIVRLKDAELEMLDKQRELQRDIEEIYKETFRSLQEGVDWEKGFLRSDEIGEFIKDAVKELENLQLAAISVSQAIGNAIGSALTNGIVDLVTGANTVKQVFADLLQTVGQILANEGAKMIATYIAIGIAKLFAGLGGGSIFGGKVGVDTTGALNLPDLAGTGGLSTSLPGFAVGGGLAAGGPVSVGTPYVVGERGPELFLPSTGGNVMSNNDLRSAMGSGSAGNGTPVLNMSFQTTNIGGVEYVSRDQLEQAMAATRRQAASDGAKRGMTMTLDKLQQSPGTRSRVGLR